MTERYTGYYERGPYPGEDPDLTRRQGGWLYLGLGGAVILTLVSIVFVATWPLAILAWAALAILWTGELVAKRAAARLHHSDVSAHERDRRLVWDDTTHPVGEGPHVPHGIPDRADATRRADEIASEEPRVVYEREPWPPPRDRTRRPSS